MADPRCRMVPDPSFTINDVIMTSLIWFKIINVFTIFLILSDTLLFRQIASLNLHVMPAGVDVENNEYIILSNFGGPFMSKLLKGAPEASTGF